MFQKMSTKFALDFISLNRPDSTPAVSYDNLYSSIHKQMDSKQERDIVNGSNINLKIVHKIVCSYKPDLNIVCEDGEIIQTYKLLLGMSSKLLGDIFLQEDFVTESVTTLIVPIYSKHVKLMLNYFENGFKLPDDMMHLFSGSASLHTFDDNAFDNDKFMPEEMEDEDDIKVEEEGELHLAKPVLIKFQSVIKASESRDFQSNSPKIKCLKCGKKYRFLNKHTQEKCDNARTSNKLSRTKCPKTKCLNCGVKYRDINKHTDEQCYKERTRRPRIPCELCGNILRKAAMKLHMERFHNSEERTYFNCDKCTYRSLNKVSLTRHMRNHEGMVLETCYICGGKYKALDLHILRNHTNDPNITVKCEVCGKEVKKLQIKNHIKKMHMERQHACNLCSYKAQSKYNLKLHISKSHLGVKELEKKQCPHCDVCTTNLPYHLKIYHPC